jgi:hypothetical protein
MQSPQPPGAISSTRAAEVFADLASQSDIVFGYLDEGCHARAHLMVRRLLQLGLTPRKVWTIAAGRHDPLWVHPPARGDAVVTWDFHVAPTLAVLGEDSVERELVFDPSLLDRPVTVDEWRDAQHDTPRVIRTALGEPPLPERGGSGYWPLPDPKVGIDEHARRVMNEVRALLLRQARTASEEGAFGQ